MQQRTALARPSRDSTLDARDTAQVATHHDGMSGTERQDVANDYELRISEGHVEVEVGVALALKKLTGITAELGHCNCNAAANCLVSSHPSLRTARLSWRSSQFCCAVVIARVCVPSQNMSMCAFTTGVEDITTVAWNPLGQNTTAWLRVPVTGSGGWTVADLGTGAKLPAQLIALDTRTKELPLLYINSFGMKSAELAATKAKLANKATHVITFAATLPAVGFSTFRIQKSPSSSTSSSDETAAVVAEPSAPSSVSNGVYTIKLNQAAGMIESVTNEVSGASTPLNLTWGFYESSEGGCTTIPGTNKTSCSSQASGAYMFRPAQQFTHQCDNRSQPTLTVVQGPIVTEITQKFAEWATHTVRLTKGSKFIEVEWTAGPIPMDKYPGQSNTPSPPLPAPGGCASWRQTGGCNSHGPREPQNDKPCNVKITSGGMSGYCECAHGVKVYGDNCGAPAGDAGKTCSQICDMPVPAPPPPRTGKEIVLKFNSALQSKGTFYTDSNGREMVKRQRDARGPSYPPYVVGEPVAGNYYPVNSMISLDDSKTEMVVVVDTTMGGSSMSDGSLEVVSDAATPPPRSRARSCGAHHHQTASLSVSTALARVVARSATCIYLSYPALGSDGPPPLPS